MVLNMIQSFKGIHWGKYNTKVAKVWQIRFNLCLYLRNKEQSFKVQYSRSTKTVLVNNAVQRAIGYNFCSFLQYMLQ